MCLAILIPMLFFQYGVADVLPDDFGMDNSAASSIAFVMVVSFLSTSVHSMRVVVVVMCSIRLTFPSSCKSLSDVHVAAICTSRILRRFRIIASLSRVEVGILARFLYT